jgi:capsular exopolysaccharide synthesis family protein
MLHNEPPKTEAGAEVKGTAPGGLPGGLVAVPAAPPGPAGKAGKRNAVSATPKLSLLVLLGLLRRRWLLTCCLGLTSALAAATAGWLLAPAQLFTARARIHIASSPEGLLGKKGPDSAGDFANFQKTQVTVVKSKLVLKAALKLTPVADQHLERRYGSPLEWLMEHLEVDFTEGPEILRISLSGDDREELTAVVNGVMTAYLDEFINNERTRRRAQLKQLEKLRAERLTSLQAKRRILQRFAPRLGVGDPKVLAVWQEVKLKALGEAQKELLEIKSQLRKQELKVKELEASRTEEVAALVAADPAVEARINEDRVIKGFLEQVAGLKQEIAGGKMAAKTKKTAQKWTRGSEKTLRKVQKALKERRQELLEEITRQRQEQERTARVAGLARARQRAALLAEQEKMLSQVITGLAKEVHTVGKESLEMEMARTEVGEEEDALKAVKKEIRGLTADLMAPARAKPLDDAIVSRASTSKKRFMFAGVAGLGVLGAVCFAIAFREFHARRVESPEEVAQGLGVELVGTLPAMAPRKVRHALAVRGPAATPWQNFLADSVDSYRTLLMHVARAGSVRSVMVTSAMPGEGKTSLASHLAVSLARAGRKTLLLDTDLRKPTLHRLFNLPLAPGLSEILRGEIFTAEAIRVAGPGGLAVLPAGALDARALHALAQDRLRDLFQQLKQHYDFIIADSCPVLPVADSLLVGQHVDGVVLSIMRDVSRMPKVLAAHHRLAVLGIKTLGVVVIGTTADAYGYWNP